MSGKKEAELKRLIKEGSSFILDTSSILAYLHGEKGGNLLSLVAGASSIPFIALTELYYITWQKTGKARADTIYGLVKSWHIPIFMPEERVILSAGRFKALYRLGIADSYVAASALISGSVLVAKDPDYAVLRDEIKIFQLVDG